MPQLDILCHQTKPPMQGMGYILLSHCPRVFGEPLSKHHRLSSRLWATIHHLMVRLYC